MASSRPARPGRCLLAAAAALITALTVTGCVSMPSAGPVRSYPMTQGAGPQNQPYPKTITGPPGKDWSPTQIVQGFLTASASFVDHRQVARSYLTAEASKEWHPSWSAIVYKKGPKVEAPVYPASGGKNRAMVSITGTVQAHLSGQFKYAVPVPSASAPAAASAEPPPFQLVRTHNGQWRISQAPTEMLLSSNSFHSDYQLRNLYFFDPKFRFLVPDPVYVPLQATPVDLMNGLVRDLISQPSDWLADRATRTAFPSGTKLLSDTIVGVTAVVNLGGAIDSATNAKLQQVSAQLLWTLNGLGQAGQAGQAGRVQSIEVERAGKPWVPSGSQGNPVQREAAYKPPTGASKTFYYLDGSGEVMSRVGTQGRAIPIERIGAGFSRIAVSPDGRYLAALNEGILYTGLLGDTLAQRGTGRYATMSWGPNGDLWVTTVGQDNQIFMLHGDATTKRQLSQRTPVSVFNSAETSAVTGPYSALRVAPDGVRVAVVTSKNTLNFGAISWQASVKPGEAALQIVLSPFSVDVPEFGARFTSLTWYGPDNVITLTQPGPYVLTQSGPDVTEYPVNGGLATDIPAKSQMGSITASAGSALIAELAQGHMAADASLTGSWTPVGEGTSPVYPG